MGLDARYPSGAPKRCKLESLDWTWHRRYYKVIWFLILSVNVLVIKLKVMMHMEDVPMVIM